MDLAFQEYTADWTARIHILIIIIKIIIVIIIEHFTVVCLVAWPLNESETGVDLVLIVTSLLFLC